MYFFENTYSPLSISSNDSMINPPLSSEYLQEVYLGLLWFSISNKEFIYYFNLVNKYNTC